MAVLTLYTAHCLTMAVHFFIGVLLIIVNVIGQQTDYNCYQRPPMSSEVKNCCRPPTLNLDKYQAMCYSDASSKSAAMNPCGVDCVYTQAGALNNSVFNIKNLNSFLNEIMPNSPGLVKVMVAGFQKCGPETQTKMQEFQQQRPLNGQGQPIQYPGQSCSPFAVLTTFCAMRYSFINCPTNLWANSTTCNKAQDFVRNCDPMQFGGPKSRGRKRRGVAIPMTLY